MGEEPQPRVELARPGASRRGLRLVGAAQIQQQAAANQRRLGRQRPACRLEVRRPAPPGPPSSRSFSVAKRGMPSFFGACPARRELRGVRSARTRSSAAEARRGPPLRDVREDDRSDGDRRQRADADHQHLRRSWPRSARRRAPTRRCQKPTNWSGCLSSFLVSFLVAIGVAVEAPEITDGPRLVKCAVVRSGCSLYIPPRVRHRGDRRCLALGRLAVAALRRAAGRGGARVAGGAARRGRTVSVDGRKPWGLAGGARPRVRPDRRLGAARVVRGVHCTTSARKATWTRARTARSAPTRRWSALTYTLDVLRLVPYVDLQAGRRSSSGARSSTPQSLLAMELGVGADYFVTRRCDWPGSASTTCSSRPTCCPIR